MPPPHGYSRLVLGPTQVRLDSSRKSLPAVLLHYVECNFECIRPSERADQEVLPWTACDKSGQTKWLSRSETTIWVISQRCLARNVARGNSTCHQGEREWNFRSPLIRHSFPLWQIDLIEYIETCSNKCKPTITPGCTQCTRSIIGHIEHRSNSNIGHIGIPHTS